MQYSDLVEDIETLGTYVTDGYTRVVLKRAADAIELLEKSICPHYIRNVHDRGDDSLCRKSRCEVNALPRWIPVTERLPEEYVCVLCYCSRNGQYGYGELSKGDNGTIYWTGLYGMIPTHWMPLPMAPKEETE
jgi:hypothetical protein